MLTHVSCPECDRRIELDFKARTLLEEKRGRELELECADGHVFSLHDAVITARLRPKHYDVFLPIQGIERGQKSVRVGEWYVIRLVKPFEHIDDVKTTCYPEERGRALLDVRSEARFDNTTPNEFWLMTSGNSAEWGQRVCVDWVVYGAVPTTLDIWRENLVFAARQFLGANYRPCVVQSAVAVESFIYDFVTHYLQDAGWDATTIKDYIEGDAPDALPLQGVIRVCIQEIMGLQIPGDVWTKWQRLRSMRNALAHGDLKKFVCVKDHNGKPFANDHDRAELAYETAVRFIYELRYPSHDVRC